MIKDSHIKVQSTVLLFILILKEKTMAFVLTAFDGTDPDAPGRRINT
jgi:hypothetical protein